MNVKANIKISQILHFVKMNFTNTNVNIKLCKLITKLVVSAVLFAVLNTALTGCFPFANFLELPERMYLMEKRVEYLENVAERKEQIEKLDNKLFEIEDKLNQVQRKIVDIQLEIERLEFLKFALSSGLDKETIEYLDQRLVDVRKDFFNLQIVTNSIKQQLDQNSVKIDEIEKKINSASSQVAALNRELANLDNKVSTTISTINNQISSITKKLDDSQNVASILSDSLKKQENSLTQLNQSISQLAKRVSDLEKSNSTLLTRISSIENAAKEIDIIKKDLDSLTARVRKLQDFIPASISENDLEFLKQLQQQIQEIKGVIQSLTPEEFLRLKDGYIYYVAKSGDTLSSIARAYNVKLNDIVQANNISDPSRISIGQVIKIPISNPSNFVRVPLKISPNDILSYHGQPKGELITVGLDIYAKGKEIYPILPGKVLSVENYTVKIDHGNMIIAVYSGVQTSVKPGNLISNSVPLGTCIDVFHFELYIEGEPRDPLRLFTDYKGVFVVTFYSEWDDGKVPNHPTFRIARNGNVPEQFKTIAVDPNVIPLGSLVYIPTLNNVIFVAEDTGSAIKGNRIDVYVSDVRLALNGGVSPHPVYVVYPNKNSN